MQTAYSQSPTDRRVGMLAFAKGGVPSMIRSKAAHATIKAGKFVSMYSTDDAVCMLPAATGDVTGTGFGFAIWDPGRMPVVTTAGTGGGADVLGNEYAVGDEVSIVEQGFVYVQCETDCALGGAVYVRFTTATDGTDLGDVRNSTDSGKAVALPGARFDENGTGAGVRRVRLVMVQTPGSTGATGGTGATGPTGPTGPTGS